MQVTGSVELRALADRLKAADDGKKLKRELYDAMNESVKPLAATVASYAHLRPYVPDPYALVLSADLTARISKLGGQTPRVEVTVKARQHRRKVKLLNDGFINHPIYADGPRRTWNWSNGQRGGMRAGFFTDAVKDATPYVREKVLAALTETAKAIAHG